jgi:hypothetical protein
MALGAAMGPVEQQTQQAMAGSQWLTSGQALNAQSNPYLQSAINAAIKPITQNFQETVLPGINDQAQLAGQFGYNRQALETNQANRDYLQSVGTTAANMASQGYGQGLQAMTSAEMSAPGVAQAGMLPAEATSAVGMQQQQMQQQAIDAAMQQYYTSQFMPLTIAQQIASMAFGMPGGSSQATQQGAGTSPLQSIIGGAGAAGGLASGIAQLIPLLSDRAAKKNIRRIGASPKGIPLYRFEFKALPGVEVVGLMAQDVPHAAIRINGMLHVDYSKVI